MYEHNEGEVQGFIDEHVRDGYNIKEIIEKLKFQLNTISLKLFKKPFLFDADKLASAVERQKFEVELRKLKVEHLQISKHLVNLNSDEILKRALMSVSKCIVRFYAVSGYDMSSRDNGSASDTYLKLLCNGKKYSERDHYQLDEPNPDFYKSYDFEAYMPGSSPLTIQVWDYDMIFGDEVVGEETGNRARLPSNTISFGQEHGGSWLFENTKNDIRSNGNGRRSLDELAQL